MDTITSMRLGRSNQISLGVMIGRFQFFHNGHLDAIVQGLQEVSYLAVLTGSANKPRTYYNPFTAAERARVIMAALPPQYRSRVIVLPLNDSSYNDTQWISSVHEAAGTALKHFGLAESDQIGLVGFKKDGTSYYLNMFPRWSEVSVSNTTGISATPLRDAYFVGGEILRYKMPPETEAFLREFRKDPAYEGLVAEYLFIQEYKRPYKDLKYPPIFVTVDACVVQSGYVLLVQRKAMPGAGLWALPGGFLEGTARIEDWIYEELSQETRIKVPESILRKSTREIRVYDEVHRSARGRTITHCGLIVLDPPPHKKGTRVDLPRVRGADDAKKADWFPLKGPGSIDPSLMFEDHYSIIKDLTSDL